MNPTTFAEAAAGYTFTWPPPRFVPSSSLLAPAPPAPPSEASLSINDLIDSYENTPSPLPNVIDRLGNIHLRFSDNNTPSAKRRATHTPTPEPASTPPEPPKAPKKPRKRRAKRTAAPQQAQATPPAQLQPYAVQPIGVLREPVFAPSRVQPAAAQPAMVPLPAYGFLHELPRYLEPHTFTPMFMSPNGLFNYYVFADADGTAKVALIGQVEQMQNMYRDLACQYPAAAPAGPGPAAEDWAAQ